MALPLFASIVSLLDVALGQTSSPAPTPYQVLPTAPTYPNGSFTNPDTATTQNFTEGVSLNITWETNYSATNVWFITNGDAGNPSPVAEESSLTWHVYTLQCTRGDCSVPYSFRAVNAFGTESDQQLGGFWSGQFWILPSAKLQSMSATANPIFQASTATATVTTSSPANSSLQTGPSGLSSQSSTHNANSDSFGIGARVGAGVGVCAAILVIALIWRFRTRRRKSRASESEPPRPHDPLSYDVRNSLKNHDMTFDVNSPSLYSGTHVKVAHEAPDTGVPAEAPNDTTPPPPHELSA